MMKIKFPFALEAKILPNKKFKTQLPSMWTNSTHRWMSFFWDKRHWRMHSLQKTWPFWQDIGLINDFKQRQQASKGLIESLPSLSLWVPYPSFRFSSYVKKAKSLLFFECLWGMLFSFWLKRTLEDLLEETTKEKWNPQRSRDPNWNWSWGFVHWF